MRLIKPKAQRDSPTSCWLQYSKMSSYQMLLVVLLRIQQSVHFYATKCKTSC